MNDPAFEKLLVGLETHTELVRQAESFRASVLEPQIMEFAASLGAAGLESDVLVGADYVYLIDRRGRVMSKKKG